MTEKTPENNKESLRTEDLFKPDFLAQIKEKLVASKTDLEKKLGVFSSEHAEGHGTFPDFGDEDDDNVHEIEGFIVNESMKTEYEKELRDVNAALDRLKDNTYGICKYTHKKIDEKRLLARPTSSSSVEAKEGFQPRKKE